MGTLHVFNDIHIGAARSAGTTPATQLELRAGLISQFAGLLDLAQDGEDVMILGDLFDSHTVPVLDVLSTYRVLTGFLTENPSSTLFLVAGNHDLSKTSTTLSSFQLLVSLLEDFRPRQAFGVLQPMPTAHGVIVPHAANQDLLNHNLSTVSKTGIVFLHCNYDNGFAAVSDQSLNLSREVVASRPNNTFVLGHEHQTKREGRVWIPGNQICSSISDCLHTKAKQYVKIVDGAPELVKLRDIDDIYIEMDWTALTDCPHRFVRVTGNATASQAPEVLAAINSYRRANETALVIGNYVAIDGEDSIGNVFSENLASVKAFDVMAALKESLTEVEFAVVERARALM